MTVSRLNRPSFASFVVALALFGLQVGLLEYCLSERRLQSVAASAVVISKHDDYTYSAHRVLRQRNEVDPRIVKVYLLGGSSTREIAESETAMARQLARKTGRRVQFLNLGTSSQTMAESYVMAGSLPRDQRTVVVCGITISRLNQRPDLLQVAQSRIKIPFLLRAARGAIQQLPGVRPYSWQPGLLADRAYVTRFCQSRCFRPLIRASRRLPSAAGVSALWASARQCLGHIRYETHRYRRRILPSAEKQRLARQLSQELVADYWKYHAANYAAVRQLLQVFERSNSRVAFLIGPLSDTARRAYGAVLPDIRRSLRVLCQRRGCLVWETPTGRPAADDLYYDLHHLTDRGRRRMVPWVSKQLVALVRQL